MRSLKIINSLVSSTPSYLILYVTSKCNSKCKTCFYWDYLNTKRDELTLDEIQKISKNFKNLLYVSLTGGEPFMRQDIDEIMKAFYFNSNTIFFAIPTNALLPQRIVEKCKNVLVSCPEVRLHIDLSVDGLHEMHDEIRGVPGNFQKTLETYEALKKLKKEYPENLIINIHTCFNGYNQDQIYDILEYFEKLDAVDNHRIGIARADSRFPEAIADVDKYKKLVNYMVSNQKKPKGILSRAFKAIHELNIEINIETLENDKMVLPCIAVKKMLVMGDQGEVYPCEILDKCIGNIRDYDYDITKMLASTQAKELRKWILDTECHCTWGCAIQNNIIFNPKKTAPRIVAKMLNIDKKSIFKQKESIKIELPSEQPIPTN